MTDEANPVLVETTRGGIVENRHRGAIAIVTTEGTLIEGCGDVERLTFPRSSCKILQALPMVESGAAEKFGLGQRELALSCASHSADLMHTQRISAWLARLGLSAQALECGPQWPLDPELRAALRREMAGEAIHSKGTALHNTCSGKHAGMLTLACGCGAGHEGYTAPDHPVQVAIQESIAQMTDTPAPLGHGIDGCSAPNFAVSLKGLALAMARIAGAGQAGAPRLPAARQAAAIALREAMAAHPQMIAGKGRACTDFIESTGQRAVCKFGADGVYTAIIAERGLGLALKMDDGSIPAAEAVMAQLLIKLGLAEPQDPRLLARSQAHIRDRKGQIVGEMRAATQK
ncbi:MAG: asparaginase [Neomegalonema sp.]|nr:asparaginase [Neomegalonema sp.]